MRDRSEQRYRQREDKETDRGIESISITIYRRVRERERISSMI
jgi:hypothetical protein